MREAARATLLGGGPFPEPVLMSWHFVARTRAEIDAAHASWTAQDDRFGRVCSALPLTHGEVVHRRAVRRHSASHARIRRWSRTRAVSR
ncbi:pirin-like C-terminal cupin domain-containing protein [Streptomyces sp. S.PNR 29]|uniref:pirin-like C-terminal cupin domain-containing protein n=1 Tax=Streptomyces sp. S.PNR 29 TaxID=2973805 RepID=UPI00339D8868